MEGFQKYCISLGYTSDSKRAENTRVSLGLCFLKQGYLNHFHTVMAASPPAWPRARCTSGSHVPALHAVSSHIAARVEPCSAAAIHICVCSELPSCHPLPLRPLLSTWPWCRTPAEPQHQSPRKTWSGGRFFPAWGARCPWETAAYASETICRGFGAGVAQRNRVLFKPAPVSV